MIGFLENNLTEFPLDLQEGNMETNQNKGRPIDVNGVLAEQYISYPLISQLAVDKDDLVNIQILIVGLIDSLMKCLR